MPDKRRGQRAADTSDSSDDGNDVDLFRRSIGEVRPLPDHGRVIDRRRPRPQPRHSRRDESQVMRELLNHPIDPASVETGEELSWLKPGLQSTLLKRLKRGHFSVEARLDLHHMNQQAARTSILDFLDESQRRGMGCVKIIHGKGLRSRSEGPVLKALTNALLRRHKRVLAFSSARANDGGTGAVYVLLARR